MKKLCGVLAFAILTASPLLSQSLNAGSTAELLARVEARYPFPEGSRGESAVFDLIERNIADAGADIERLDFSDSSGMHSFSQVLRVSIPGRSTDRLAIAVPVSHPTGVPHSESGAIGIAAAIETAMRLIDDAPAVSLDVLFLGGERAVSGPLGSRRILEQLDVQLPDALVYIDVPGAGAWSERSPDSGPGQPGGASAVSPSAEYLASGSEAATASLPYETTSQTRRLLPGLPATVSMQRGMPRRRDPALSVVTGSPGRVGPEWLADATRSAAAGAGIPARIDDSATQLFRIGSSPPGRNFLIDGWLEAGVPSVLVVNSATRYHARQDTFDREPGSGNSYGGLERLAATRSLVATMMNLPESLSDGIPVEWDRHTIAFAFDNYRFMLDEPGYLLLLLAVVGITVLYGTIFRKPLARYIRTIRRNFWTIPLLFAAAFVYLGISGALVESLLDIRQVGDLWSYRPVETFALKVLLASGLFQLSYLLLGRLPLTSNGSFYSAAALFLVFFSILVFASINIALSVYFLLAFLGIFLFSITRFRMLKLVWLLLSLIPLFVAAWIIFSQEAEDVIRLLITDWRGDLLIAAAVLPTLLLIIRMGFLFSHPRKGRGHFLGTLATIGFLVSAAVFATRLLTFPVYTPENPQIVRVEEFLSENEEPPHTRVSSNAPLPAFSVAGFPLEPEDGQRSIRVDRVEREESLVSVTELEQEAFLGRTRYRLAIEATRPLRAVNAELRGSEPLFLYSLNFPFSPIEDGRRQEVHIGHNPPNPLFIDVVIPDNAEVELHYEVELPGPRTYLPDGRASVSVFSRRTERATFTVTGQSE